MSWETFIGTRHLRSLRGNFLSTLTVLAILGVALSVASYTTVVSVGTGFVDSFQDRVLGVNPHLIITRFGVSFSEYPAVQAELEEIPEVTSTSPFILQEMLLRSDTSRARPGALVKGLDVGSLARNPQIAAMVQAGDLADLSLPVEEGAEIRGNIAVGSVLARRLQVQPGDEITMLSPLRGLRAVGVDGGSAAAVHARFRVVAIVHSGFFDYDNRLVLVDYRVLQDVLGRGDVVTGVEVRLSDVFVAQRIATVAEDRLTAGRFRAMPWQQINHNLFASLNLQKLALQIVMSALVWVSSLVIVCVLVMLVIEKRKEIAILRALGATRGGILRMFVFEGMTIGLIGTAAGLLGGFLICHLLQTIDWGLQYEVYRIDSLPVSMRPEEFVIGGAAALLLCLLATLYPSWKASRIPPVEALRYD